MSFIITDTGLCMPCVVARVYLLSAFFTFSFPLATGCKFRYTNQYVTGVDETSTFFQSFSLPGCLVATSAPCVAAFPLLSGYGCDMVDNNCNGVVRALSA